MKKLLFLTLLILPFLTGCKDDEDPIDTTIDVTDLTVSPESVTIEVGASFTYDVTITPSDATDQTLSCTTTNSGIATCHNGRVYGNAVGSAVVIIKSTNNITTRIDVHVIEPLPETPVVALGSVSISHDDSVGALSSFYIHVGLLTEDELDVIDSFLIDLMIVNDDGVIVYDDTIEVEHYDFVEFPDSHWYTNVRLFTFDIESGSVPSGTAFIRVYKDDLYDFTASEYRIEDHLPIETIVTNETTLPKEFNTYNDATNVLSKGIISELSTKTYEFPGTVNVDIELTLGGSKTFDFNSDDTYDCVWNILLYDEDSVLIDTVVFTMSGLSPNDTFTGETIRFTDIPPGTYTIIIEDANIVTNE